MSFYDRDPTVPFWRANIDIDALFEAHGHRAERAQAWLRYRNVSDDCQAFERAVMMRGIFRDAILYQHTYSWTFTPTYKGDLAFVLPVFNDWRLVDCIAVSRNEVRVWGCITGAGQYIGDITSPLRVHTSPANWLASDREGILPLAKTFMPLLHSVPSIVAEDFQHASQLAEDVFIQPAARLGLDCFAAEELALDRIVFEDQS
jgi:hypothetical protein